MLLTAEGMGLTSAMKVICNGAERVPADARVALGGSPG